MPQQTIRHAVLKLNFAGIFAKKANAFLCKGGQSSFGTVAARGHAPGGTDSGAAGHGG
jgi:hypothetical protein